MTTYTVSLEVTPESFANTGILRTTGVGRTLGDVAMGKGEEWCVTYRRQIVLCEFYQLESGFRAQRWQTGGAPDRGSMIRRIGTDGERKEEKEQGR